MIDWSTQTQDLQAANMIIEKHLLNDQGLGILEITIDFEKQKLHSIQLAPWVKEMITFFETVYGKNYGHATAAKVLTRMVLKGETIH